ncbi:hypothetical protein RchiOBHm_Chr1g0382631 [Rosa chinensis]|uniref:Uncharacterized protein n=1 Tax=Rosa chinensis TaxID=74649 RepID=A0A2P6SPE6_ROSCH|nr:hypothetical protein RchiOBHm_Chr1g0382631 [Rosa chinensis]
MKRYAWAKESLLREQNKELATSSVTIQKLKEPSIYSNYMIFKNIFNKKRGNLLSCRNRLAQEAILFKDEQLSEAQAWITRVQEMDALQSTTLQNQLREHSEHYNQLWLALSKTGWLFAEMERHHMHTVQQLQLELADARQRNGTYTDESRAANSTSKDASQFGRNNGNQIDINTSNGNPGALPNGNSQVVSSFSSTVNASSQVDHVPTVPIGPSSLLGMPPFLPPGLVTGMHPFVLDQPGVPHSMPPQVPQSHVGNFHSIPAMSSLQQWQNQQAPSESLQIATQTEPPSSQNDQNLIRLDAKYHYETSVNGQPFHQDYLDVQIRQGAEPEPVISSSPEEAQVLESINSSYLVSPQTDQSLQQMSYQFN